MTHASIIMTRLLWLTEFIIIRATSDDGRTSLRWDSPSHTASSCHM